MGNVAAYLRGLLLWLKLVDRLLTEFDRIAWPPGIEDAIRLGDAKKLTATRAAISAFLRGFAGAANGTATPPAGVGGPIAHKACELAACYQERFAELQRVCQREFERRSARPETIGRSFILEIREWRTTTAKMLREDLGMTSFRFAVAAVERLARRDEQAGIAGQIENSLQRVTPTKRESGKNSENFYRQKVLQSFMDQGHPITQAVRLAVQKCKNDRRGCSESTMWNVYKSLSNHSSKSLQ